MDCQECKTPMMFTGVEQKDGVLEATFNCRGGHAVVRDVHGDYEGWVKGLHERVDRHRKALVAYVPNPVQQVGLLANLGELFADVIWVFTSEKKISPEDIDENPERAGMTVDLYTDGSCNPNPGPAGWGLVVLSEGTVLEEKSFPAHQDLTVNEAEYSGFLEALEWVRAHADSVSVATIHTDSQLVQKQVEGGYKVRKEHLAPFAAEARIQVDWIREHNITLVIRHIRGKFNPAHAPAEKAYRMAKEVRSEG